MKGWRLRKKARLRMKRELALLVRKKFTRRRRNNTDLPLAEISRSFSAGFLKSILAARNQVDSMPEDDSLVF